MTKEMAEAERLQTLENLQEVAGMNCEQLPYEVREALHKIPAIEKTHGCELSELCEVGREA